MRHNLMNTLSNIIKGHAIVTGFMAMSLIFVGCTEVGLGPAVDLEPPRLTLTTPKDNDTKPYTFRLKGNSQDNEKIDRIEIDFGEADMKYLWDGGTTWKKRSKNTNGTYEVMEPNKAKMVIKNGLLNFYFDVDLKDAKNIDEETSFTVTAQAYDKMGNTGKKSKDEKSFTVDIGDPNVSINQPQLFVGSHADAENDALPYVVRDPSSLSKLINGKFRLQGHQDGSMIFQELMIELDNDTITGTMNNFDEDSRMYTSRYTIEDPTCNKLAGLDGGIDSDILMRDPNATVYYRRRISLYDDNGSPAMDDNGEVISDLRNFWLDITEDELAQGRGTSNYDGKTDINPQLRYDESNPDKKEMIRVVSTSVSSSGAWERRVLGYFIWCPGADIPWSVLYSLDSDSSVADDNKSQVYPGSKITGVAYDDDGVQKVSWHIQKRVNGEFIDDPNPSGYTPNAFVTAPKTGDDYPINYQFNISSPNISGIYKIDVTITDNSGRESVTNTGYFRVLDIKAPVTDVNICDSEDSVIVGTKQNEDGTTEVVAGSVVDCGADGIIRIKGSANDDGDIKCVKIVYIDPSLTGDVASKNLINFMSGTYKGWGLTTIDEDVESSVTTSGTNKIFTIGSYKDGSTPSTTAGLATVSAIVENKEGGAGKTREYTLDLSLTEDLGISDERPLTTQQFVVMAVDNSNTTSVPKVITLTGDKSSPKIALQHIIVGDADHEYTDGSEPPKFGEAFSTATITGLWSDDDSSHIQSLWGDPAKRISITWRCGKNELRSENIEITTDGNKWSANVKNVTKDPMGTITVKIKDFAGNEKSDTKSYYVATSGLSWVSISTLNNDVTASDGTNYYEISDGVFKAGDVINLITVFSSGSNIVFEGGDAAPELELNIKNSSGIVQKARYVYGNTQVGTGGKIGLDYHAYTYTVKSGDYIDKANPGALLTATMVAHGNNWYDNSISTTHSESNRVGMTSPSIGLSTAHDITVDTVPPYVEEISVINDKGYYNEDKKILVKLTMNETISCVGEDDLRLTLKNESGTSYTASDAYTSGKKDVIFVYTVGPNDNAKNLRVDSLSLGAAVITDIAGNVFDLASVTNLANDKKMLDGIIIDTTPPATPSVRIFNKETSVDYRDNGTARTYDIFDDKAAFVLGNIESGATVYYQMSSSSLTNDTAKEIYNTNTSGISFSSNGTFYVRAMQQDLAGNEGVWGNIYTVNVDRGIMLQRITSSTPNDTYTTGGVIDIELQFRKKVTIAAGTTITLNVVNGSNYEKATVIDGATSSTTHIFRYTVGSGVKIPSNANFNHKDFSITVTTSDGKSATVKNTDVDDDHSFLGSASNPNKEIKITTGAPVIKNISINNTTFTITWDKEIQKGSGNVTLTQSSSTPYRAPIVLSETAYNTLASAMGSNGESTLKTYYEKTTNGATKVSGNTLQSDTTTKYVLKYNINEDDSTLVNKLIAANQNKVIIPMYSSSVSAKGAVLTIALTGSYSLPTIGASYDVIIDGGVVRDVIGNVSVRYTQNAMTTKGLEQPVIRVKKTTGRSEKIANGAATQQTSTTFKINKRNTVGTIKYTISGQKSALSIYTGGPVKFEQYAATVKPTPGPKVNTNNPLTYKNEVTLDKSKATSTGSSNYTTSDKIVIHAKGYNRVYYWGGNVKPAGNNATNRTNWPGMNMAKEGNIKEWNNWNTITLFGTNTKLILNKQNNENDKTGNLSLNAGEWWYANGRFQNYNPDDRNCDGIKNIDLGVDGLKFALCAYVENGSQKSSEAYEYACMSVVYVELTPSYYGTSQGFQGNTPNNNDEGRRNMWIRGGDSSSGENRIPGFPLSWSSTDYNGIHLMTKANYINVGDTHCNLWYGLWYYTSWDINSPACVGILAGDVPGGAATAGPKNWCWLAGGFLSYNTEYQLYPGEKLLLRSCFASRFSGMEDYHTNYDDGAHDITKGSTQMGGEGHR